ncbi:MAG: phtH [Gammaproteobacteria bacterium]|jgi:MFS family permease|nr:phtH [Gammaproteobacteria bacterium]
MNSILEHQFSNWKAILLYSVVSFFLFFEMAVQVSPSVMATQLIHDFNIGAFGLGIMSSVYFYSYTAMQIPSGILFDKYNPRVIITLSILVCALGTLLFSLSKNIYLGSIARLLMGSGSAFAFVAVLVVTADLFKAKYFATMTGITQMLAAFGAMAGQMPISILVSYLGWRHTLWILTALGILLSIIVWSLLKYERDRGPLHLQKIQKEMPTLLQSLKKIISNSQTWYIALYACLLWAPISSFASLWGVPFLISTDHLGATTAAFLCSFMWLGLALASPLLGMLSTAMNNRVCPLAISALIGALSFGIILEYHLSLIMLGILLFFAGAACAGQALSFTLVKENNLISVKASAIAFNNMAVVISGAVFQPLIGKLIESNQAGSTLTDNPHHFKQGLFLVLAAYIIAFIVAIGFIKEPKH